MVDLTTYYMGLKLRTPLVVSASPLSQEINSIRRLEEVGASAVVLYSLFEEQLRQESLELDHHLSAGTDSFAESLSFFPQASEYRLGPEGYLEHIRKARQAVGIPIIASLNGATAYSVPTDADITGAEVEQSYIDIVKSVKKVISIPVAVKISPFFSNLANMAKRFDQAGVNGLVLFNRFYQPDIDLEELEIRPNVLLSTQQALRLPLTWIGILYGRVQASLAGTSGVHEASDVIKLLMVGANVTMMCSALLRHPINHLQTVERGVVEWMQDHDYESVRQLQGSMSQLRCPDPAAFERAQYMRAVKSLQHVVARS
jgi:dihydroorotate dehydrogenase (fumarate)